MYIRKILVGILIIGILVGCYIMYNITQTIFKPITAFNNEVAYIYLDSDANFTDVRNEIEPLVNDIISFETLAKKIGYIERVKGGKYTIRKGMNSNDIIQTLLANSTWVAVVIPPNKTTEELSKIISDQIEAEEDDVYPILKDSTTFKELNIEKSTLGAILEPSTYLMPWNTSAEDFRSRIVSITKKRSEN
ncbi:MAG: endolytic transglycosylase MltG [Bacteroidota bacterium]